VVKCNGCQQTIDIPLNPSSTIWSYRANALYAKAYDLGVIPHLMTLQYCTAHRQDRRPGIIAGTFPGIVLKAQKDKGVPLPEIEIDIAWIENGELTIGECKTNAKELAANEVARYITVAQLLRCKKIIISTLDDFSHALPEPQSMIASSPVSIEVVTGTQFLPSSPDNTTTPVSSNRGYEKSIKSFFEWEEATKALRTT